MIKLGVSAVAFLYGSFESASLPHLLRAMRLPIWWGWYYWVNPVAWSLYGLLTSKYGDLNEPLKLANGLHLVPLRQFLLGQAAKNCSELYILLPLTLMNSFKTLFVIVLFNQGLSFSIQFNVKPQIKCKFSVICLIR
ncbi:hypothetical protein L1987_81242 [Smallanthus sonchifolius]|uniref:Uncharacterized protein n=1 Tax=Smallanthus sonchifolius TaxID=185202 RepID=A0ACB8YPX6_9ASTR|nr:hypothetical protein L1987_81242 [Smallanthus sonchifolius]